MTLPARVAIALLFAKIREDRLAPWLEAFMPMRAEQKQVVQQPIEVILADGTSAQIAPKVLDVLLHNDRVLKFRRSSGWVTVGVDPVRSKRRSDFCNPYYGPERRDTTH